MNERISSFRSAGVVLVSLVLALTPAPAGAALTSVGLDQLSYVEPSPSVSQPYSNYGQADLLFDASPSVQYVNVAVNGSLVVQDMPVLSVSGTPTQAMSFDFNLGNSPGTQVTSSLNYVADISSAPLNGMVPTPATPGAVSGAAVPNQINVTVGGLAGPIPAIPLAVNLIGGLIGLLPTNIAINIGIPNQDVRVGECAPGAFSNSLLWLNSTKNAGVPAATASIAGMDTATGFVPGSGGVAANAFLGKAAAVLPQVTTNYFGPDTGSTFTTGTGDIDKAIAAMQAGEDVEIWGDHHTAAISAFIKLLNGNYVILVTHDTMQGMAGGTVTEPIVYNPTTGLLSGGTPGFFAGAGVRGFVDESAVPEPSTLVLASIGGIVVGVFAWLRGKPRPNLARFPVARAR
jgi:hypothetical protein